MKVTLCPMKTLSSISTPSQMNVWLEILQRLPTLAFFWISTKAPILVSSPISQPYKLMNLGSPHVAGAIADQQLMQVAGICRHADTLVIDLDLFIGIKIVPDQHFLFSADECGAHFHG